MIIFKIMKKLDNWQEGISDCSGDAGLTEHSAFLEMLFPDHVFHYSL